MTAQASAGTRHADGPAAGDPQSTSLDAQANAALDAALREAGPDPVTRAAIEHAFHAERRTWRIPELEQARPRRLERVGVVGGGTMGAGIAVALLDAGLPVVMVEQDEAALARGRARVDQVYARLVGKGRMSEDERAARMNRWQGATTYDALGEADLIIEAVFEDMDVKLAVFAELDRVARPGAVLATNTSYLDINRIARATRGPADVLGLHFFSPANIMKLLEVVAGQSTAPDTVATGFELARRLGKTPVRAGVCDGFIGNRILAVHRQAADLMMQDGASPYEIDAAVRAFGYPMGPYQMADLAGGDIGWATRKRRAATRDPALRYVRIPDLLCERDWFGQKTGRGFYLYPDGARQGEPDPEVLALIDEERRRAGGSPGILPGRDPASLPGRHDQRGRQRAARGHRAAPLGYRRGVPVRLRLSPAARRPHALRRQRGPGARAGRCARLCGRGSGVLEALAAAGRAGGIRARFRQPEPLNAAPPAPSPSCEYAT